MSHEMPRARAVFSTEDFSLIREAIGHYMHEIKDTPDSIKFAHLYHRLGRVAPARSSAVRPSALDSAAA